MGFDGSTNWNRAYSSNKLRLKLEQADQILTEMRDMNKTLTAIQVSHGKLETKTEARHDALVGSIDGLTKQIGNQNGRVTKLEHFKTTVLTKIKVIPATVSAIFGVTTIAITMYLGTQ